MKKKPLTMGERMARERIRKELRAEGVLPPPKKPLNRAKFCEEAYALLESPCDTLAMYPYIRWALAEMLGAGGHINARKRSPEAVGVARAIKLAVRRSEFEAQRNGEKYTVKDLYEATKDIFNA